MLESFDIVTNSIEKLFEDTDYQKYVYLDNLLLK